MNANIFALFQQRYSHTLQKPFLQLADGTVYSFADIDRLAAQFSTRLLYENVEPGDRVVVQVDKSPAAVALYLACLRIGAVYVPLNTAYTSTELGFFLNDAKPRVLVCRPESRDELAGVAKSAGIPATLALGINPGQGLWAQTRSLTPCSDIASRGEDDLAAILYTSGTTGRSKGAMLSHANMASNAHSLHDIWGFQPDDVLLHALPIFHIHGLFVALHCALLNASTVIFLPGFKPESMLNGLTQATIMMGVPTFYTRLLDSPDFTADACGKIRLFISGSAPMTEATHAAFTERTGYTILERYGMTEAGMITSNPLNGERIPGTVGYPLPDVEVRVTDADGAVLPPDQTGSIEVRGPNIFKGYWQLPEKTAEEFRDDGFFITGDMGVLSDAGRLSIVGREKDLVISGGYNVYPKEIEICIDALEGVRESAVIGLPHPDLGEAVTAVIVADGSQAPDEGEVIASLEGKLARFKQPRRVLYIDELPRNAMGKVQKNVLRCRYQDTFTD